MTDIVFSFDTEDYVNDNAADGILRAAKLLRSEGIKGDFNVVGRLAEKLREWQRDDIICIINFRDRRISGLLCRGVSY